MTHRSHRHDALEEVLIEEGRLPPPRRSFRLQDIETGWDVVDNRDVAIGTVEAVGEGFVTVHRGLLSANLYVPTSGVGEVREGVVVLNVDTSWIATLGWTHRPRLQDDRPSESSSS